jgi:hypothetical protein
MKQIWIEQGDIAHARVVDVEPVALADGQVRVRIERYALTSNNLTYAAFGESLQYWQFYPTGSAGQGIVPVWGFAQVVQSLHAGVAVGERLYGYWPMAEQAVLTPAKLSPQGFFDGAAHRRDLHPVYNRIVRCAADPWYRPQDEGLQAVLRPLFVTSWLIDDFLADQQYFGSTRLLLSSASSKTAWGSAWALAQGRRPASVEVVGLTSRERADYCRRLGLYDRVLDYDEVETALDPATPSVYVDFAGNAALRRRIHAHCRGLAYSCAVGGTHVDQLGGAQALEGPRPVLFFAPAQIKKRQAEWGADGLEQRMLGDWWRFVDFSGRPLAHGGPPLRLDIHAGIDGALQAYRRLARQGAALPSPDVAQVVELHGARDGATP